VATDPGVYDTVRMLSPSVRQDDNLDKLVHVLNSKGYQLEDTGSVTADFYNSEINTDAVMRALGDTSDPVRAKLVKKHMVKIRQIAVKQVKDGEISPEVKAMCDTSAKLAPPEADEQAARTLSQMKVKQTGKKQPTRFRKIPIKWKVKV
jgi:hypothetical protein